MKNSDKLKSIKFILIILIIILNIIPINLFSQSGVRLSEFERKLEQYFSSELISDVRRQLPQGSDFTVWGWDVGDFSGDGVNDLGFTIKLSAEKRKIVQVYLFVDIDGYLTKVEQIPYEYIELPLEIGVLIKSNTCYVTKKQRQFDWTLQGYRFDNGTFMLLDEFTISRIDSYTREIYRNFQTLFNSEKYNNTNSNKQNFKVEYLSIPSYQRGRLIYKGFNGDVVSNYAEFCTKGAFYWKGEQDASFTVSSAYDEQFLYMTVTVRDDKIIQQMCDTCPGDYIEFWFDATPQPSDGNRFARITNNKLKFREPGKAPIYCLKIYPGDFYEKKAYVKEVSTSEELEQYQKESVKAIKAVSSLRKDGYEIKFKIPFMLFGFETVPIEDFMPTEYGCSVVLHDFDNEWRPEEETVLSTSVFDQDNPLSFGSIIFVPQDKWYGQSINIYRDDILKYLVELGF